MKLASFFRKRELDDPATRIYGALVAQARAPGFYRDLGVPDTVEGRFEMIALHAFLVLNRLKAARRQGIKGAEALGQAVFDLMFADMDRNLREMGTGDLGVAKRVKSLAKGFYGRIAAYDGGLAASDGRLAAALDRNVFAGSAREGAAEALARYMKASIETLAVVSFDRMEAGHLAFAPEPEGVLAIDTAGGDGTQS